jgi:ribonuclease E
MSGPGFDSPPSLALEEEFAASEADYSASPSPDDAVHHEEAPEPSSVVEAETHKIDAQTIGAASEEPTVASFAAVGADVAPETPASAPPEPEPTRPRRNGWWQRARASVIGK